LNVGRLPVELPASALLAVTVVQVSLLLAGTLLCGGGVLALGWYAGGAAQRSLCDRYDSWHRGRFGAEGGGRHRDTA
jgi:hypothetical protein